MTETVAEAPIWQDQEVIDGNDTIAGHQGEFSRAMYNVMNQALEDKIPTLDFHGGIDARAEVWKLTQETLHDEAEQGFEAHGLEWISRMRKADQDWQKWHIEKKEEMDNAVVEKIEALDFHGGVDARKVVQELAETIFGDKVEQEMKHHASEWIPKIKQAEQDWQKWHKEKEAEMNDAIAAKINNIDFHDGVDARKVVQELAEEVFGDKAAMEMKHHASEWIPKIKQAEQDWQKWHKKMEAEMNESLAAKIEELDFHDGVDARSVVQELAKEIFGDKAEEEFKAHGSEWIPTVKQAEQKWQREHTENMGKMNSELERLLADVDFHIGIDARALVQQVAETVFGVKAAMEMKHHASEWIPKVRQKEQQWQQWHIEKKGEMDKALTEKIEALEFHGGMDARSIVQELAEKIFGDKAGQEMKHHASEWISVVRRAEQEWQNRKREHEKQLTAVESKIAQWLTTVDYTAVRSANDLKAQYLQQNPQDKILLETDSDQFDRMFADAYRVGVAQEQKELNELEKRTAAWITGQQIDLTKVKSGDDLRKLYLQKYPQDKARYETYKQHLDPLFAIAYTKALNVYEVQKKQAKADITKATDALLTPEDIANASFSTQTLFAAAMLSRLQGILMQHKKPDALYRELETYAKIVIKKLHTIWQKKHEALENVTMKEELSRIEIAVASWTIPVGAELANFDAFRNAFLQACPDREIVKKHEVFANDLLKLKWAQYSISQDLLVTQSSQKSSAQPAAASAVGSESVSIDMMNLEPAVAAALLSAEDGNSVHLLDDSIRNRFSSVDWDSLSPALTSFLHQNRLRFGSDRVRRLTESQKMQTLLSGREDKLAPFLLAMCSTLENEGEIARCQREFELSDDPKDTIRILLASDDCRRAAYKVRQSPVLWTRFVNSLATIGLSLKDLHLDVEDEEQSAQDIDAEMVQEVVEEHDDDASMIGVSLNDERLHVENEDQEPVDTVKPAALSRLSTVRRTRDERSWSRPRDLNP